MRKLAVVIALVVPGLLTACGASTDSGSEATTTAAKAKASPGPALDFVVFTGTEAEELLRGVLDREPGTIWEPSDGDVENLLDALPATARKFVDRDLAAYKAQFVGIGEGPGKRVFGSFFCDSGGVDWQSTPVVVKDGGDCYFQVTYDPETGDFGNFFVNAAG